MHKSFLSAPLLACAMALSGCGATLPHQPLQVACPKLPPAPASVMQQREADFQLRMRNFLFEPLPKQTK